MGEMEQQQFLQIVDTGQLDRFFFTIVEFTLMFHRKANEEAKYSHTEWSHERLNYGVFCSCDKARSIVHITLEAGY